MSELTPKQERAVTDAEQAIQRLLLDLCEQLESEGLTIQSVSIDTRNFANMRVEIFTEPGRKA